MQLVGTDCSGAALAEKLVKFLSQGEPLTLTAEQLRRQFAATAFDGQYEGADEGNATGLSVPRHLCRKLELDGDWCGSKWDGGHLVEIGMKSHCKASEP